MKEELEKKIKRALDHAFGYSSECIANRKKVTDGILRELSLTTNGNTRRLKFTFENDFLKVRVGKNEFIEFPFVPYEKIDEEYLNALNEMTLDDLSIDEDIQRKYFERFR